MNLPLPEYIIFVLLGIGAGSIAACINSFKDSPYEIFVWAKFFRSFILGAIAGSVYYGLSRVGVLTFDNLGILLLAIIPAERGLGELYKGFLKKANHVEYVHAFENLGMPLKNYGLKLLLALGVLAVHGTFISINIFLITPAIFSTNIPFILKGALIGAISTLIVAIGGGVKDSQFEGWDTIKFFRSPFLGLFTGAFLIFFTQNPLLLFLSNIGLERTVVELYKTFITRRTRGLHQGKEPSNPEWFSRRWIFFGVWCLDILLLLALLF